MDSDEHGAVSVGSPSQAAEDGALLQLRDLNLLPPDQDGSHSDHAPHSAQTPEADKKNSSTSVVMPLPSKIINTLKISTLHLILT